MDLHVHVGNLFSYVIFQRHRLVVSGIAYLYVDSYTEFDNIALLCISRLAYLFNIVISLSPVWEKSIKGQATIIPTRYGQLVLRLTGMTELLVHCSSVRCVTEGILGLCLR